MRPEATEKSRRETRRPPLVVALYLFSPRQPTYKRVYVLLLSSYTFGT